MFKFLGLFIFLGLFSGFCGKPGNSVGKPDNSVGRTDNSVVRTGDSIARYGEKIRFSKDAPVYFENFGLTYIGERRVAYDVYPNGFVYHDFKVKAGNEEKTVSWSSGTGEIGPAPFEIGGKKYDLELAASNKLGNLAENELVIWKKQ